MRRSRFAVPPRAASLGRLLAAAALWMASFGQPAPAAEPGGKDERGFVTLCYHDVIAKATDLDIADAMPVFISQLTDQFDWLRDNGYTVIGIDDVLAARRNTKPLPEKAVLLSFDDGLASFRHYVYPLLKAYNYKALLALQTTWLETPANRPVQYGASSLPRTYFLTWAQIKEMADSGLVELASHSHDLHRPHDSMPQDGQQPRGSTLAYDKTTRTYESVATFYQRIRDDVARSAEIIAARTGHRPRVMVWPYGRYNQVGAQAALDAGYLLTASLGLYADGVTIARFLMHENIVLHDAMAAITRGVKPGDSRFPGWPADPTISGPAGDGYPLERVVHVDLDMVHDPDPKQEYKNISALFDRISAMKIGTVYLQAYADPDGNGTTDALYFPNRHLPVRADLFNYVAWQLHRRIGVEVYAWMPVMGFELPGRPLVTADPADKSGSTYGRLTPFDPENRRIIREIYEDLARQAIISGILYHDDALFGDYEDDSPPARAWRLAEGLPEDLAALRRDAGLFHRHSRMKTRYLIDFTDELTAALRRWSPPLKTARNLYAQVALHPDSETWYAQNLGDFLARYDYVGLMAMPYMEGADAEPDAWLRRLAASVRKHPLGAAKTVFELQAVDWRAGKRGPIPSETLARQMRLLAREGIGNFGYYPENPFADHPDVKTLYPVFSLEYNPFLRQTYPPKAVLPTPAPPTNP